jgi:hypothetical protein
MSHGPRMATLESQTSEVMWIEPGFGGSRFENLACSQVNGSKPGATIESPGLRPLSGDGGNADRLLDQRRSRR